MQLKNSVEGEDEPTVKVKVSGDGARMSHSSSLFVCSFALLEESQNMLSSAVCFFLWIKGTFHYSYNSHRNFHTLKHQIYILKKVRNFYKSYKINFALLYKSTSVI